MLMVTAEKGSNDLILAFHRKQSVSHS